MIQKLFGKRVKKIRKEKGIKQKDFAESIGLDRSYYVDVEAGNRNISLINIEKIANGLEKSISEIFENIQDESND